MRVMLTSLLEILKYGKSKKCHVVAGGLYESLLLLYRGLEIAIETRRQF